MSAKGERLQSKLLHTDFQQTFIDHGHSAGALRYRTP